MLLAYLLSQLAKRLRSINLKRELQRIYDSIMPVARKVGRTTSQWLMTLYYAISEGDLTPKERAFTYAALIYVLVPGDLLPRRIFGLLGITDDATALIYAIQKIKKAITPEIRQKAQMKVDEWFGPEISNLTPNTSSEKKA